MRDERRRVHPRRRRQAQSVQKIFEGVADLASPRREAGRAPPRQPNRQGASVVCQRVTCKQCDKPTWVGCGRHIEQALRGVPVDQRCTCPRQKSLIERLFGRRS
jgi:hypothetical protein